MLKHLVGASRISMPWSRSQFAFGAIFFFLYVLIDIQLILILIDRQPLGIDFLPIWTASRLDPSRVYEFIHVTLQQGWPLQQGLRPFINPPTALWLLQGLGALPFHIAYPAFVLVSFAIFAVGAHRLGADWRLCLLPHYAILVVLVGQVTFLVGGLTMIALTMRDRPYLSGLLFGIVGALKPQMLVLLPLAFLAERNWRAIAATAVTGFVLILITLPGGASWAAWLEALPRFASYVSSRGAFLTMSAAPYAHLGPATLLVSIPVAIAGVWLAFRQEEAALRVLALLGGALLIAPYALNYELTLLIPAMLAYEKTPRWSFAFWVVVLLNMSSAIGLVVAILLLWRRLVPDEVLGKFIPAKVRTLLFKPAPDATPVPVWRTRA